MKANVIAPSEPERPRLLADRLRRVHAGMIDAVLSGDGMREVAQLAARHAGGPVAVVIPQLGHELVEPARLCSQGTLARLVGYARDRAAGRPAPVPDVVAHEVPVHSGDTLLGMVLLLEGGAPPDEDTVDTVLHLAAMAALTELALVESRHQVEDELRGSFLEELRAGVHLEAGEVLRRGARLGCDLSRGAALLACAPAPERKHRFMAAIRTDIPDAFVQALAGRVYAVVPATDRPDAEDRAMALAEALARRLRAHAPVGLSTFHRNPAELGRAIAEADLVVDVLGHADLPPQAIDDGTYRLLIQMLASHPTQLDAFFQETLAPVAAYDERYGTELVETMAAYLDHDCNMNATAAALYTHRHTIAYRLQRIRDLTDLDPARHEHRERLGLGVKIHRLTRCSATSATSAAPARSRRAT
jgi:sugar diacid utilization regulator